MPIDTLHPAYDGAAARWKRCRDAVAGQDAVHAAGIAYLPRLTEQKSDEYAAYKTRAGWYGATGRTHQGLLGMVFRKPPVAEMPAALLAMTEDIDLAGTTLEGLAREVVSEVLEVGRVALLVEYPAASPQGLTLAQAQAQNVRSYVSTYRAEHIRQWREMRVGNVTKLGLVVLREMADNPDPTDPYTVPKVEQLRALMLLPLTDGRMGYVQRLFKKNARDQWEQFGPDIIPLRAGAPLDTIPLVIFAPDSLAADISKPPLLDLADVNFSHYRSTADLEHGAHFAGLPTAVVSGYTKETEGERLCIGSAAAWVFPDPQAKAEYLEFTGQGLGALEKRCEVKEAHMAALGARMLAPEKTGVEAAETLAQRHSGEASVLAGIAMVAGRGLERVLQIMAQWEGISGDISYKLNDDYMPAGLSAQDLTALVGAWQAGAMSWETLFANLKRGEIVQADTEEQDERDRLDAAGPPLAAVTLPNGNGQ